MSAPSISPEPNIVTMGEYQDNVLCVDFEGASVGIIIFAQDPDDDAFMDVVMCPTEARRIALSLMHAAEHAESDEADIA
jgi:hypothetical protein